MNRLIINNLDIFGNQAKGIKIAIKLAKKFIKSHGESERVTVTFLNGKAGVWNREGKNIVYRGNW